MPVAKVVIKKDKINNVLGGQSDRLAISVWEKADDQFSSAEYVFLGETTEVILDGDF
jgi:hypothetical protein